MTPSGMTVAEVESNSPASGKLQKGDILMTVDKKSVADTKDAVAAQICGMEVRVYVFLCLHIYRPNSYSLKRVCNV